MITLERPLFVPLPKNKRDAKIFRLKKPCFPHFLHSSTHSAAAPPRDSAWALSHFPPTSATFSGGHMSPVRCFPAAASTALSACWPLSPDIPRIARGKQAGLASFQQRGVHGRLICFARRSVAVGFTPHPKRTRHSCTLPFSCVHVASS